MDVGKGVVGQRLKHARLPPCSSWRRAPSTIARALRSAASRLSWAWIALSIWLTTRELTDVLSLHMDCRSELSYHPIEAGLNVTEAC